MSIWRCGDDDDVVGGSTSATAPNGKQNWTPVGRYVLVGERAIDIGAVPSPPVANEAGCSTLEIRTMRCFGFVDCVNDFVSENRDFVRCGLQTTQGTFFKKITQIWSSDAALAFNDG